MTQSDLLDWQDEDFVVGVLDETGRYLPGRAAKWKAGEELMAMMDVVEVQEVVVGGDLASEAGGVQAVGEKEEENGILYGHYETHLHLHQPVTDQDDPSEAFRTAESASPTPDPGQSTSFQSLLNDFGIWVPLPRPRFAGYSTGNCRMAA